MCAIKTGCLWLDPVQAINPSFWGKNLIAEWFVKKKYSIDDDDTTRLKKKAAPYFEWMYKKKKLFENFFVKVIWKIFEFSFILDQSQICISNGLGARALQKEVLFC